MRGAVFVDSGSEWGYKGETSNPATGEVNGLITTNTGGTLRLWQLRDAVCGSAPRRAFRSARA